jgi:predicted Zn-dependent peptidase
MWRLLKAKSIPVTASQCGPHFGDFRHGLFYGLCQAPLPPAGSGLTQNIAALNSTSVKSYFARRYVGANISVVVVGDVNPAAAHILISRYFSAASATRPQRLTSRRKTLRRRFARRRVVGAWHALPLLWRFARLALVHLKT